MEFLFPVNAVGVDMIPPQNSNMEMAHLTKFFQIKLINL